MFFLIFLELHLLDLCVDTAESFSKWLFNRSVWKIFLTCEEKYFSSHVMDFFVKKKIEVLTKWSQQLRKTRKIKEQPVPSKYLCNFAITLNDNSL